MSDTKGKSQGKERNKARKERKLSERKGGMSVTRFHPPPPLLSNQN